MTLPSIDDFNASYGGSVNNYSNLVDPSTQWSAGESNPLRASVAGMTATCFKAVLSFSVDGYGNPTLLGYQAVWNTTSSTLPVLSKYEPGIVVVAFPSTVIDLLGATQSLLLHGGFSNISIANSGTAYFNNVLTIQETDISGNNYTEFQVSTWSVSSDAVAAVSGAVSQLYVL